MTTHYYAFVLFRRSGSHCGVKRFEDTMGCSVSTDVPAGVFISLLKLCTAEIHSPASSYTLDLQDRDGFGMLEAAGAVVLLMSSRRREIIVFADFNSGGAI